MASPRTATVVIRPSSGWIGLGAIELWKHRDLAYFLVWRDLKVRYKQTAFGAAWAVLQPVLLMLVFSAFLGQIKGIGSSDVPYPLFALSGLVPWTLFSQSLSGASNSLVNSQNLISKVYFPRLLLPLSAVASYIIDFLIAAVVLVIAMLLLRAGSAGDLPVGAGAGHLRGGGRAGGGPVAGRHQRPLPRRQVRNPVPHPALAVRLAGRLLERSRAAWLRGIYALNPMAGVIEAFRWATLGGAQPDATILVSAAATVVILIGGLAYFRRVERTFADTI